MTGRVISFRRPPPLLIGFGIVALGVAIVLAVGWALGRWPVAFDRSIMLGLRAHHGPPWVRHVAAAVTWVGNTATLTAVVVVVAVLLAIGRHWLTALATVLAALSGGLAVTLIKRTIGRPRPTLVEHWASVHDLSFPSGHSASSAVVYLTIAALLTQLVRGRAARRAIVAGAVLLVGAIGLSRVYLGVHWPSDVLAGWSLGAAWALGWWHATASARASLRRE